MVGTGEVSLPPDVLTVRIGAEVTGRAVPEALDRCSEATAAMAGLLRQRGVADRALQTAAASIYQAHDHNGRPRGWTATQQLVVRLRDLPGAGDLISAAVATAGDAARLQSVTFDIDRTSERYRAAQVEARRRAFADAQSKADQYAQLAGRRLGVVISVRESHPGYSPPIPLRQAAFRTADAGGMPVESGELDVTATVEVRWELVS